MVTQALDLADIWLFQAIYVCEKQAIDDCEKKGQPPSIEEVIAAADYINHAVMTFEELSGGLWNLKRAGLLQQIGQKMKLASKAMAFFQKFETQGIYEQAELVRRELGAEARSKDYQPQKRLAGSYTGSSREQYGAAVKKYALRNLP